jgi:hypothetical protein
MIPHGRIVREREIGIREAGTVDEHDRLAQALDGHLQLSSVNR